ncbi:histidine kinase [Pleurocapsa sp. CCALA 161]|uniref:histidine kinase n=1 Tax=Pleurocapsa sp. CCALA 161 TaxID=2107688 RepID=UPI000D081D8B|nr:histidine kinase [Pleurocapsa sp. CCALA 161]PSB08978.1 histidine kinase [Pleurocapsa sp. CCALA 161]
MLHFHKQCPDSDQGNAEELLLQLLLFVDQRSSSEEQVQEIKAYLHSLRSDYAFKLDVVEIEKQPHLVEFFRLVATPALVKMSPAPRQTLAGSNLIQQLEKWWPQWKEAKTSSESSSKTIENSPATIMPTGDYDVQGLMLSDEIFSLRQEKAELEAQLRFKDKILAMLAHDLRTPLTAASMAVETIQLSEKNEDLSANKLLALKRKLFRQARNQFNIMDNMIGELLQNSQNNHAKLAVKPKPLNLCSLCQDIASQFDAKLGRKSMNFVMDVPQDLPLIYADAELIRQLISNLLDNAIKYTPEKGSISLSVLHRTNQKVQVSICDTGPGIPTAKREQIFEDNFRLQRDRAAQGYGLGLATCQQIVSAHYGQIWVDSAPESGSCFRFTLLVYK